MNKTFASLIDSLEPKLQLLKAAAPFKFSELPAQKNFPVSGIYLFSEDGRHLYVGRSAGIKARLQGHCRVGSQENKAAFAFRLAREKMNVQEASYQHENSRKHLMTQEPFRAAFEVQKERLRRMDIRVVEESDHNRQALLEMYAAISLETPYNTFKTS
jgi:hypothetical protein